MGVRRVSRGRSVDLRTKCLTSFLACGAVYRFGVVTYVATTRVDIQSHPKSSAMTFGLYQRQRSHTAYSLYLPVASNIRADSKA